VWIGLNWLRIGWNGNLLPQGGGDITEWATTIFSRKNQIRVFGIVRKKRHAISDLVTRSSHVTVFLPAALAQSGDWDSIPGRVKRFFSFLQRADLLWVHPTSCPINAGNVFPGKQPECEAVLYLLLRSRIALLYLPFSIRLRGMVLN
jgi:hypothetical protein